MKRELLKCIVSGIVLTLLLVGTLSSTPSVAICAVKRTADTGSVETVGGSGLSYSSSLSSEPPEAQWNKTYGGANHDYAYSAVHTIEGYAIGGYTDSLGAGLDDFWLVKTGADGNAQWNRTYGGTGMDHCYCLLQPDDGGYVMAGATNSSGVGDYDFWLVKTDLFGGMQWNRTYGGTKDDVAWSVVQTSDGGYIMAGSTDSFGAGFDDVWLVKTDASGNMQWNKTYGGGLDEAAYSVIQTSDGGYAMVGYTASSGAGSSDFWLIKTDASGNIEWSRTYGGSSWECAQSVIQTSDGGYAIAGQTRSFGVGGDSWLIRTDASGRALWNKTYGGAGIERAYSVVQGDSGGYAMAGFTTSFALGKEDFWLVKTDADGNMLWNETFGGTNSDVARCFVQTSEGQYLISGYTWSFGSGLSDFWLIKVGSIHDIAVIAVAPSQTIVEQGEVVCIDVTVQNQGDFTETFNVTTYSNSTAITTQSVQAFAPKTTTTLSLYWNTTTFSLGNYEVSAVASTVLGETDEADNAYMDGSVRVARSPTASFVYAPELPEPNSPVAFDATLSTPNGGTIIGYTWCFGDTNVTSVTDPAVTHVYASSGTYNVTLTVTDSEGLQNTTWKEVPVYTRDLAMISVSLSKVVIGQGYSASINVTVENQGDTTETVHITLYADQNVTIIGDEYSIGNQTIYGLASETSTAMTFRWNTTGFIYGNYTISAVADTVPGETDTADNTLTGRIVHIGIPGDINADGNVDIKDVYAVGRASGTSLEGPNPLGRSYNPNYDINDDGKIDLKDCYITCKNYGRTNP